MGNASTTRFALVLMIPLAAACGADAADPVSQSTAPIVNGTPFTDTVGYVSLTVGCSGTMISPQWVLTAGHCFRSAPNDNPIRMETSTTVYLGTDTTHGQTSSDVFIHPNWWHPGETPPNQPTATFWNSGYDVALVRLPSPQPPYTQYPGHYYNQLSNGYMNAGESVTCAGYGYTSAPFRGGGIGDLRNAQLPVTFVGQITTIAAWSSIEMIEVLPNNGQIIYNGDSGGGCYTSSPFSDPWVISGITSLAVFGNGHSQAPTAGWLVYPWYVEDWVDATMHASPSWIPTDGAPTNAIYTEALGRSQWGDGAFVFASDPSGPVSVSGRFDDRPFGAFSALDTANIPTGPGPSSGVGIATTNPGELAFELARIGGDGDLYTATLVPAGRTAPPWGFYSFFGDAGRPAATSFVPNTPAVAYFPPNRVDYFALGADGQLWTRTNVNYAWQGDWAAITGAPPLQGAPSVTLAWGSGYYVTALDGYGSPWMAAYGGVDGSGGGGPWSGWFPLGGNFLSGISIAGWDRGMDFYGIGLDSALWHYSVDNDFQGSGWFSLGGFYSEPSSAGVTASSYFQDMRRIDISVLDGYYGLPQLIQYPR